MNTHIKLATLSLLSAFCFPISAFSQGSLTPPGAPAPTMKTLDQVEARTPITNSTTSLTISQPGSYYLTRNLTVSSGNAITIATNSVTLDLNGFTISSTAASATGSGIYINSGLRNITIANGFIQGGVTNDGSGVYSGSGFAYGISYVSTPPVNVLVSRVSVSGCLNYGIYLSTGDSTVAEACTVWTVGAYGIVASIVKASSAVDCGDYAIYGTQVSDCRGETTSNGAGVAATTVHNCYGSSSSGIGLYAYSAHNCYGSSSSGTGLYGYSAQNCYGSSGGGYGVIVTIAHNCYGSSSSGTGLYVTTAHHCYGYSTSGPLGLYAQNASFCTGHRSGGRAIEATIANGCYAAAGTNQITYKYNMP